MALSAVIGLIKNTVGFAGNPCFGTAYVLSKSFIGLVQNALNEDISGKLKKNIADSELETAKIVMDSINLEAEENRKNGINRAITHLESAFNLYCKENELESSCICALYISLMHKAIGNVNEELHKSIWLRVPLTSREAINFGDYGSYVRHLFSEAAYDAILHERREERIRLIDRMIVTLKSGCPNVSCMFLLVHALSGVNTAMQGLRIAIVNRIMDLKEEKQLIHGKGRIPVSEKLLAVYSSDY